MTIAERITDFRLTNRLSETLLAQKLAMSQGTLNRQIRDDNLSLQTILAILKLFPNLSAEWLLLGVGNMYLDEDESTPADTELQEVCIEQAKEIFRLKKRIAELETLSKK